LGDEVFSAHDHLIVDVSALPTSVYFALVAGVLDLQDAGRFAGELQVVVAENAELDSLIEGEGPENPDTIARFGFGLDLEPSPDRPILVWAPVLGERAAAQLEALHRRLAADEICPVLPFPSRNPRRADNLLLELREVVVDMLQVEPGNYMYADESNPIDLYRGLTRLSERYRDALSPVGAVITALSIHSSKTLSLGALMAAYENQMPVMNADPEHYHYRDEGATPALVGASRLACLWLEGLPRKASES
jgi:hypothetical protein